MSVLQTATQSYADEMADVPVRELRNDTAGVLRRVEAGEDVTITAQGLPEARLAPVVGGRRPMPREEFVAWLEKRPPDPDLRDQFA